MSLWQRWVARVNQPVDARPLALVRVFVCTVLLLDLLRVWQLGLVTTIWRDYDHGGLTTFSSPFVWIDRWPDTGGPVLFGVAVAALTCALLGVGTRPAMLVAAVAYSQLGHLFPPGDRGIDRVLRTVLLLLVFTGSHRRFALLGAQVGATIRRWPMDVIRFLLVMVYLGAAFAKVGGNVQWWGGGETNVLMRILSDPMAARLDPTFAILLDPLWRIGAVFTVLLELSSPLLLTKWARWWALLGLALHLGIAATMKLGMFAWGMMALYPVVLGPWLIDEWRARRG
ncbi:MAG: HTTM domain-containing protein [Alphaproteobacteria bacterium]|nr:HTTM domain-containing protein [Alphaproteobacteria bacterium]